jgi:putative SbcD/Mre11-related phosphoesterase
MNDYLFFSKTIFFPEQGILAVGDLHLGYEEMLLKEGITFPLGQTEQTINELEKIILKIKKNYSLDKIVFLGDIKHHFNFEVQEKFQVRKLVNFLRNYFDEENIILIKGNHDKIELDRMKYYDFFIEEDIAFFHGDKLFEEVLDKKIKTLVIGHIHPSVVIKDKSNIKKEKYKCFLVGKFRRKKLIIVPSFFGLVEGSELNESYKHKKNFSFISDNKLAGFEKFVVGKDRVYEFGKL